MKTPYTQAVALSRDLELGLNDGQVSKLAIHLQLKGDGEAQRLAAGGQDAVRGILPRPDSLDAAIQRLRR